MPLSIGFIGAGQMARALAQGVCAAKLLEPDHIWAADVSADACAAFRTAVPGSHTASTNAMVLQHCGLVFLAVKPQHLASAAQELRQATLVAASPSPLSDTLFVSIAAGVPLRMLTNWLGTQRVVRVMPNTPCLVGAGASAYCLGSGVAPEDEGHVVSLLESVGTVVSVPESLMDAVTGLSGSGPAYVFLIIEALADAGVLSGLPRSTSLQLAAQTVLGSARMVLETRVHPAELRDRVTSPGGTTANGLQALEEHQVRAALLKAVQKATQRSQELGQAFESSDG
ncbi:MAG: pyrroline-5-carboxylate reductase [Planctomycetota bacterium]|nr:pyrroline-5-carboxylate reductase [Planctomycetota bacterium]